MTTPREPDEGLVVPADPSALDDLPPYDPTAYGVGAPAPVDTGRGVPLDLSKDPDRFDADLELSVAPPVLDPSQDPDRFRPTTPGRGQTLEDLLGEGAHEEERDGLTWLLGLAAVLVFLGLVAFVATQLGPG